MYKSCFFFFLLLQRLDDITYFQWGTRTPSRCPNEYSLREAKLSSRKDTLTLSILQRWKTWSLIRFGKCISYLVIKFQGHASVGFDF